MAESDFLSIFSRRLRYYLAQNDMTQKELADKLGVGTTSVYNWTNGVKSPRMDKVDAMCKIFHCRRIDLMEDSVSRTADPLLPLSREEESIIRNYRASDESTQLAVCAVLGVKKDVGLSASARHEVG